MDAKSGSVLPTTPRIKGISMVRYNESNGIIDGKFSNSMRYHTLVIRKDGAPSRLGDKTIDLPSPLEEAYQGSGLRQ